MLKFWCWQMRGQIQVTWSPRPIRDQDYLLVTVYPGLLHTGLHPLLVFSPVNDTNLIIMILTINVFTCSLWKAAPPSSLQASWDLGHLAEIEILDEVFHTSIPLMWSPLLQAPGHKRVKRLNSQLFDILLSQLTRDWILVRMADTS